VFSQLELADFKEETWLFGNYGLSFAADLPAPWLLNILCLESRDNNDGDNLLDLKGPIFLNTGPITSWHC